MSQRVWKYTLTWGSDDLELPQGAIVLSARFMDDVIVLWAQVDPGAPTETRRFCVAETGQALPDEPRRFIGTVVNPAGEYVYHVYELTGATP